MFAWRRERINRLAAKLEILIKFRDAVQRDVPRATLERVAPPVVRIGIASRTTRWPPLRF
jgi:hypothetical protein